jgi:F0F1-type ATP synthase membrane subunit c/vacuolar-type H+-ATPase subunit K
VSPYEWGALAAALALLGCAFYAGTLIADALVRFRRDPDATFRRFLTGRWWV